MAPTPRDEPNMNCASLYNNVRLCNMVIKFSGREIKAHRFVLCEQNKYFEKLFGPDSPFAEAKETEVTLLDDDPDAVEAFIRSLYNFELEDFGESTSPSMIDKANFYCNVVVVADKYGAEDLIEEASENLGLHLDDATPADLLASLELITEEYGRYERLKLCASEKVFLRLDELIPLNGFPTWLASQPILFKTFMGQASLYRTLERQGHYKCSACKRELVGSMDHSAPQCCRKAPVFMGKALSPLIISARGGVRGGDQRRPDIR